MTVAVWIIYSVGGDRYDWSYSDMSCNLDLLTESFVRGCTRVETNGGLCESVFFTLEFIAKS